LPKMPKPNFMSSICNKMARRLFPLAQPLFNDAL
jgi:hypothetical protein